ncbi:MAG: hypothetical protein C4322_02670 [Mastigocladus sp. ERB_26_1]
MVVSSAEREEAIAIQSSDSSLTNSCTIICWLLIVDCWLLVVVETCHGTSLDWLVVSWWALDIGYSPYLPTSSHPPHPNPFMPLPNLGHNRVSDRFRAYP